MVVHAHWSPLPPRIPKTQTENKGSVSRANTQMSLLPLTSRSTTRPSSSKVPCAVACDGAHRALATSNRANSAPRLGRSSTLPKLMIGQRQSMKSVYSEADSERHGTDSARTVSGRAVTTVELMKNPQGPPLDYSFLDISDVEELRAVMPRSGFRKPPPERVPDEHRDMHANPLFSEWKRQKPPAEGMVTQGLKLSNNVLSELPYSSSYIFREVMEKPHYLRWIDLSFNALTDVPAVLGYYAHLTTVYLHANQIQDPMAVMALAGLKELRALTMHGNPCEQAESYRVSVLATCPGLKKLDFGSVTIADRERAGRYAESRRHRLNLKLHHDSHNRGPDGDNLKHDHKEEVQVGLRQAQARTVGGVAGGRTLARG